MTKEEFLNRMESEKLDIDEYIIILDKISDAPLVLGCAFDDGKWKVYQSWERKLMNYLERINNIVN